ncbi:MAG TPA: hypothetical protein VNZ85_02420 [Caulobacter sp.]|nr:hypothetical protein [Caulobacter sp.]
MKIDQKARGALRCRILTIVIGMAGMVATAPCAAQTPRPVQLDAPVVQTIDPRGVDLISGAFVTSTGVLSIGADGSELASSYFDTDQSAHSGFPQGSLAANDHYTSSVGQLPCCFRPVAQFSEGTTRFQGTPSSSAPVGYSYTSLSGTGATLEYQGNGLLKYTTKSGTVAYYTGSSACARLSKVIRPNGEIFNYAFAVQYTQCKVNDYGYVYSNTGYMLRNTVTLRDGNGNPLNSTLDIVNMSVDRCDMAGGGCTLTRPWPTMTLANASGVFSATDAQDRVRTLTVSALTKTIVQPSGQTVSAVSSLFFNGCNSGQSYEVRVTSIVWRGGTWTYAYSDAASACANPNRTVTITDPAGGQTVVTIAGAPTSGYPDAVASITSITDPLGRTTRYEGTVIAPTKVIHPEGALTTPATGDYDVYEYDSRLNIKKITSVPKSGSGQANIVREAGYDATCANIKTCNKPNYIIDANGNRTDYSYDPNHGGLLTETGPAGANGLRPQTRYIYQAMYGRYRDGSGSLVNTEGPIYKLTRTEACASSTNSCAGTADETVTTYNYDPNNLLLVSKTRSSGDGALSATESYGYDDWGNRLWTDGPLPGDADRSFVTYDLLRRPVFEISPDPDGGPQKRKIIKHNYNVDGVEYLTEVGAGNATDGSDFVATSFTRNTYDTTSGLLIKTEVGQP